MNIASFSQKRVADFLHSQQTAVNYIDTCVNLYDLSYAATDTDALVALVSDDTLDGVTYVKAHKLTAEKCLKLSRGSDTHLEYNIVTFPQEVVKSVTLYANIVLPKNLLLREEYINTEVPRVWDWMYDPDQIVNNFVPVKTIDYPTGWFSFGTIALPRDLDLHLNVDFEVFKNDYTPRVVLVKNLMLSNEHRDNMWNENLHVAKVQNLIKRFNKM